MLASFLCEAQLSLTWKELQLTQFEIIAKGENTGLYKAKFQKSIKTYEDQEVVIAGFIVPMDIENNTYALSLNPFISCFFCGNAGPNTVIELTFENEQGKFLVDQYVIIKGVFKLNRDNPNELFFKITEAKIHG
jgi:hypothetical protein